MGMIATDLCHATNCHNTSAIDKNNCSIIE